MAALEIAVEIGTGFTSIYLPGNGIVLREPTVIAFIGDPKNKRVHAVGAAAEAMIGKTPERTTVVEPVVGGIITQPEACGILLREFVKKIVPSSYVFFPRIKAVLGIPTGLDLSERNLYEEVCAAAGIADVVMVENILLSGLGIDMPVSAAGGGIVVNIGAGATEIAALSLAGVVSGCGVTIGGQMIDKAIVDHIAGKYDLKVGTLTARKIKEQIGSLYENDTAELTVSGRSVTTKNIGTALIAACEICGVIKPYYLRIADAVESIINMCPPEIVADIHSRGLFVVGGGSKILGLEQTFSERLGVRIHTVEDPSYCVIMGAGKLVGDKNLLQAVLLQK